jgi:hypothetical protein
MVKEIAIVYRLSPRRADAGTSVMLPGRIGYGGCSGSIIEALKLF